jgi:hypothetical protein
MSTVGMSNLFRVAKEREIERRTPPMTKPVREISDGQVITIEREERAA